MSWLNRILNPTIAPMDFTDAFGSLERLKSLTGELDKMDTEIHDRENRLLGALDNIEMAIWAKDADNRFVYVNQACCDTILHCTKAEALRAKDTDFEEAVLADVCTNSDEITKARRETVRFIEHAVNAEELWLDTVKSPWLKDGKVIGTVGTGKNITDIVPEEIRNRIREPLFIEIPMDSHLDSESLEKLISCL